MLEQTKRYETDLDGKTDWFGLELIETDWFGLEQVETDWFGSKQIETDGLERIDMD